MKKINYRMHFNINYFQKQDYSGLDFIIQIVQEHFIKMMIGNFVDQ